MTEEIKKEGNKVSFDMIIHSDRIEEAMTAVFNKEKHQFQLPGFRKGKVPRRLLESSYGADLFFEDAVNDLIPEIYEAKTDELKLKLAGQPNISLSEPYEKGKDVVLNVEVEVLPEIELKDYSKIEIPEIKYEVTDELIYNQLEAEKDKAKRAVVVEDRSSKEGDVVVIDYTGFVDEKEFEGGSAEGHSLTLGSNQFIPGFEEQLIGKNTGDDVEVKVTFPEDYGHEDLAGKEAIFDVHINEIQEIEYPEIDDEFIKDISEFDTVDEYRADVRKKMEADFEKRAKADTKQVLLSKVADFADFVVPEAIIENGINREIENFANQIRGYGLDFEQYMEMTGGNKEEMRENFRETAYHNSKVQLVMEAIIEKEEIDATDEEIAEQIKSLAEEYFPEDELEREKFVELYSGENSRFIKDEFIFDKAVDKLMENVVFVEPEIEEVEEEVEEVKEETNTEEE